MRSPRPSVADTQPVGASTGAAIVAHAATPVWGSPNGRTTVKQRLRIGSGAPGRARKLVEILGLSPAPQWVVTLLVSELVTNAILHSGRPEAAEFSIALTREGQFVAVEVWDRGAGFAWERSETRDITEPGGLGLVLVDRLAHRWGIRREAGGAVWFVYRDPTAD